MWLLKVHFAISILCLITFLGFRAVFKDLVKDNGYENNGDKSIKVYLAFFVPLLNISMFITYVVMMLVKKEELDKWIAKNKKGAAGSSTLELEGFIPVEDALDTRVKYLRDVQPIEVIKKGDWIDLRAGKDILIFKGQYRRIPLGVAIELPKGYEALMAARSSTFEKYGVIMVNGIAVIDESYCGDNDEWHFLAYATKDTFIRKNDRICQFRVIEHQPELNLITADTLGNADRGGIGSTGVM